MDMCGLENALKAREFHRSFPMYKETPLHSLNALADECGVSGIYIKDESYRFGLNAFKVLGGSFAIGNYIAERTGEDISGMPFEKMISDEVRDALGELTFITATDGNHGRGVAWTANVLKQKSIVYMPKGTARERLDNILKLGSDASITELSYDDAVRKAAEEAEEKGYVLVQDTSWAGYEKIPATIMQGYTTMALETVEQLHGVLPTHVFLQAGVGSMAGAVTSFLHDYYRQSMPRIIVVEPETADCCCRTAEADDGKLHAVESEMNTIMAGLACGEVCPLAWEILKEHVAAFVRIKDASAENGMRLLARPRGNDPAIVSGESGAAGFSAAYEIVTSPERGDLKKKLGIGKDSVILCFSTEGATDRENYRRIVEQSSTAL